MIIMTGFAGLAGTQSALEEKKEKLLERFSKTFLDDVPTYDPEKASELTENILQKSRADCIVAAGKDGIFAALWELGEAADCGMRIDTASIPILQETIEIADILDINPYEDDSTGCFLFIINGEDTDRVMQKLRENDIAAFLIGYETKDRDRLLIGRDGERRFLTPLSRIEAEKKQRENYKCQTR